MPARPGRGRAGQQVAGPRRGAAADPDDRLPAVTPGPPGTGARLRPRADQASPPPEPDTPKLTAELVEGQPDTLRVPNDVVHSLAVQTAAAHEATAPQPLELAGSLALDTDRMVRVHSRFAGEVVELGKVEE